MNKKIKIAILLSIITFISFKSAYADVPIGGAMVMAFPLVSIFGNWGLALLVAILVEMMVLRRKLDLRYFEAGKLSLYANVFSTLIGAVIVISYSSNVTLFICWIPGSILLVLCFNSISEKTGFLKNFPKIKYLGIFPFLLAIGAIGLIFGIFLTPELAGDFQVGQFLKIVSFAILLITGFILTLLTETYIIARCHSEKSDKIVSSVFLMNLISYIVLFPIFMLSAWNILFK